MNLSSICFKLILLHWPIGVSHLFTFLECCILDTSICHSIHTVYGLKKQMVCICLPMMTIIFNWLPCVFSIILLSWIQASCWFCSSWCFNATSNICWDWRVVTCSVHTTVIACYRNLFFHSYSSGSNLPGCRRSSVHQSQARRMPSLVHLVTTILKHEG